MNNLQTAETPTKKALSRRDFLKASGALFVTFSAASVTTMEPFSAAQGPFDTHLSHVDPAKLDSWLAVGSDGTVTAYTGKCDFGQGMLTAQAQLVAEELCVAIDKVKFDPVRHSHHARSRDDLRQSIDAHQFQRTESGAGCGHRSRGLDGNGGAPVGCARGSAQY